MTYNIGLIELFISQMHYIVMIINIIIGAFNSLLHPFSYYNQNIYEIS